jgi:tetratricopeptide (TPR) repeat protein
VRALRAAALLAALGLLCAPELPRYRAERRLGLATNAFRTLLGRPADADIARNIAAVGEIAAASAGPLPGDPRPWILAGSSWLVTGRPDRALEDYREAFATGERAEIDLNLGRAYAQLQRNDSARAAWLRAGWVSPEILGALPAQESGPLAAEIAQLDSQLRKGDLDAPPPLPDEERR